MTDEERQRQMDFIVRQQTQTTIRLDRLTESVTSLADSQHRADERLTRTEGSIRSLLAIAEIHEREIMAQSKQIAEQSEQIKAGRAAGQETDERLNALINMVERYLGGKGNGGSQRN